MCVILTTANRNKRLCYQFASVGVESEECVQNRPFLLSLGSYECRPQRPFSEQLRAAIHVG